MADNLRLMCVLAHPDDESLGTGGVLVKYAAEGIETYLVTATRGEHGWWGSEQDYPGPEALGKIREAELRAAAAVLGLREVNLLDYVDGHLDQADPAEAVAKIVEHMRRVRPHIVISFGPEGVYGHPDHIAISLLTTAAIVAAADPHYADLDHRASASPPHRVSKLYYMTATKDFLAAYQSIFGDVVMHVDGMERRGQGWEEWAITAWLDTEAHWRMVWRAVACHQSQLPGYSRMENLPEAQHRAVWGVQTYYRAFSLVNGGRARESDLFAGLR